MDKHLPITKIQRGKVVGKTLLKISATRSKAVLKRTFSTQAKKKVLQEEMHEEVAKTIFEALGELKGMSIKIAQQIALGMPFLPPTYLEQMQKSFHKVPPINKALVRKIIKTELGGSPEKCFDEFESSSFGSASLGQVHHATIEGESVAVKIQYPGIKKSIESDMSILRFGLKKVAKGNDISHIVEEIGERLHEEVDYEIEAQNCTFFAKNLHLKDIIIPTIYEAYSTKHILSSSYLEGDSFETFLASSPSQEYLNHYAQLIFDSYFHSLYTLKIIHADPNPGNFIFMEDGKLGLIDFGCVKKIDDAFLNDYNRLHLDLIAGISDEEVIKQYADLGMIDEGNPKEMLTFYQETIKPLDRLYIEIFHQDHYDFKVNNDFSKRGFHLILEVQKKQFQAVHKINQEFIFLDRTLLGYYAIFERMGAVIDTREAVEIMRTHERRQHES
ncbi:MAG: AarF/ABC1/UbiB kinase family protein [Epsilonproteobacteria bacterium]|nr:AarF/ABC1/UbiB kinase family protein [Campylobacterota bacterium]